MIQLIVALPFIGYALLIGAAYLLERWLGSKMP